MNVILIGFSTTGKSTIRRKINVPIGVESLDSDEEISKDYNSHIYNLFIENHNNEDPIKRTELMDKISHNEDLFIAYLKETSKPYIAALGPNIHTRSNWNNYYVTQKPFTIFLKADVDTVYRGLIDREDKIISKFPNHPAFGNWNHGVIREYNPKTNRYERLSEEFSKRNIAKLIVVNEERYSEIADLTVDATSMFNWHPNYRLDKERELIETIEACLSVKN
ncbi:MAG: hypothetical protein ACKV1O_29940 [Saprospiraceae bacterium]